MAPLHRGSVSGLTYSNNRAYESLASTGWSRVVLSHLLVVYMSTDLIVLFRDIPLFAIHACRGLSFSAFFVSCT